MATEVSVLTDIEGSTRRWADAADRMRPAVARHDAVLGAEFTAHGGRGPRAHRRYRPAGGPA